MGFTGGHREGCLAADRCGSGVMDNKEIRPLDVTPRHLPEHIRGEVSPESPIQRRLLYARALLPMDPATILSAAAYLLNDKSTEVSQAARRTLKELPENVLGVGLGDVQEPTVLDRLARFYADRPAVLSRILTNPHTADETVAFLAQRGSRNVVEQIATMHVRLKRMPYIIEALYYNPETRMGVVTNVLEFAAREGIDLSHIPGYEEILESVFGESRQGEATQGLGTKAGAELPETDEGEARKAAEGLDQVLLGADMEEGAFNLLLQAAAMDVEEERETAKERKDALWVQLSKMTVPEKVRLALLGNEFIRSLLIKDSRRVVYMAVLKSPKTSEKEAIQFAKDRSLPEEVIRTIATNRDWTKLYAVRHALCTNPKCPPVLAMHFLKTLHPKDLKLLAKSHDVPGYVIREAKRILYMRGVVRH